MSMVSEAQSDKSPFHRSGNKGCVGYSDFSCSVITKGVKG
jgi:hypothetical protein